MKNENIPNDIVQRLIPNEVIQFWVTGSAMSCYFTDKRIMYKINTAAKTMANSRNFSLLHVGVLALTKRQDYNEIPYKHIQNATIESAGFMPKLRIYVSHGKPLDIAFHKLSLAQQVHQFVMSKIL